MTAYCPEHEAMLPCPYCPDPREKCDGDCRAANLHRDLNRRTADALGLLETRRDPETGEEYEPSWHDMPEQVAALRSALSAAETHNRQLRVALADVLAMFSESGHPGRDCLRTGWVPVEQVEAWRRVLDGER